MSRPVIWILNAAQRTLVAFLPSLARPDDEFAGRLLTGPEYRLYQLMDARDRVHAVWLARRLLTRQPDARGELVRAALLHDVGKAGTGYNPLHRIAAHLYAPADIAPEPRLTGLAGAWQLRRHHHRYGAELIRSLPGSEDVARLVERHHRPDGDPEAELLRELDDET